MQQAILLILPLMQFNFPLMINHKQAIINQIHTILNEKIESAKQAIDSAKESRDNETKSSVGDKYETSRTMVQFELEKHNIQLLKAQQQKHELSQINLQKKYNIVDFGCLVYTNQETYFISIGLGKIEIGKESIYCISLASPLGKILYHKSVGDKINFQGRDFIILEINDLPFSLFR